MISHELYLRTEGEEKIFRNAKKCKEHYISFLRPEPKKGHWYLEEDYTLMACMLTNGLRKNWCKHIGLFPGRTESALKNRFKLIEDKLIPKNTDVYHVFRLITKKLIATRSEL